MSEKEDCLAATNFGERVCGEFARNLREGEEIMADVEGSGILPRSSDKAVLTDERVMILKDGIIRKKTIDLPTSQISSSTTSRGILRGCVEVETSTGGEEICSWDKGGPQKFSDSVRSNLD